MSMNTVPATLAKTLRGSNQVLVLPFRPDGCADVSLLKGGAGVINDPTLVVVDGRFERDNSKESKVNCVLVERSYNQGLQKRVFAQATRPIKAGEELYTDYGTQWSLWYNKHAVSIEKDRARRIARDCRRRHPILSSPVIVNSDGGKKAQNPPGSFPLFFALRPFLSLCRQAVSVCTAPGESLSASLLPSTSSSQGPQVAKKAEWRVPQLKLEEGLNMLELLSEQKLQVVATDFRAGPERTVRSSSSKSSSRSSGRSSSSSVPPFLFLLRLPARPLPAPLLPVLEEEGRGRGEIKCPPIRRVSREERRGTMLPARTLGGTLRE
uniref:SET domain-containing protein n=1 Tax=Chromera velia CCMP2878 TaxID=1169474 RepID=A0A0G4HZL8_9ALVE|eukprot:Cvel_1576.t1-p1 / transcript=Cvel_1576.t1 / gene=Cvel_1576 / organism=Chromera_velia_CCMP2878 / gene_product=hypothetical protein / transcript_product=hypothetical protein / location=Cvel_scaffold56:62520-63485(-) / protein_length=322 / sequence_SO=supercontig / SO=protein_coding / is_pseudo=false